MAKLTVIFIDVGWGDSIFIEHVNAQGKKLYGLVDSNDSTESLSSYTFIKQHFEQEKVYYKKKPAFHFVLLTHWHGDHHSGLKRIIKKFGTHYFWYPKSWPNDMAVLRKYANGTNPKPRIVTHEAVNRDKKAKKDFGDVNLKFHWPPYTASGPCDNNPNNTSAVMELEYDGVRLMLTGDCQAEKWNDIIQHTNKTGIKVFQAPHHGAKNGMFHNGKTPWLDFVGKSVKIALSSHIHPHKHPNKDVIKELLERERPHFRTDEHYHLTFEITNGKVSTKWSHF
ncbi:MAG: MBL fold metallo-hydrolase [Pseudomonadota bacterium]